MMDSNKIDEEAQADIPEPSKEEETLKIRPLERINLYPKAPIEPSAYGKGKNFSRPWILQDGREVPGAGSEMRDCYKVPKKSQHGEGIRKRMLTDFFWEQMLDEVIEELATSQPVSEYCTEYDANFVKESFEPRNLEITADKNMHLKYPLYGTGSRAITFYSESIKKSGPVRISFAITITGKTGLAGQRGRDIGEIPTLPAFHEAYGRKVGYWLGFIKYD